MTKEEMQSSIERLSELRSKYNCFDEKEKPFYYALTLGIKGIIVLEQESILDKIRAEISDIYCGQYCENPLTADEVREMALEIIDKCNTEGRHKNE